MRTNYSNIRYHIYRELSKIQRTKKNERSQLIDEITVPIFSGVISASVAGVVQREISNMFLFIPIISFVFLLLLFLSKCISVIIIYILLIIKTIPIEHIGVENVFSLFKSSQHHLQHCIFRSLSLPMHSI